MDIQSWKNAGQYFTYKERHQIFYQLGGNGENLILLHGFPTSSWDWNKRWPELTERFKVFAPDFIGFGYSDKPKKYTYSIHDQADLIENFPKIPDFNVVPENWKVPECISPTGVLFPSIVTLVLFPINWFDC